MSDSFAASLGFDVPQAPPPQGPGFRFTDILAAALGSPVDRSGAYQKGLEAGSQYRLRSAQTESALAEAEKRRQEAMGESMLNVLRQRGQDNPGWVPSISELLPLATGANDFANAQLGYQEHGNRALLSDPNAAAAAQFAAGQGVQGRVLPRVESVTPGREIDLLTQQVQTNPIGDAQIRNYDEQPGGAVAGAPLIRSSPIGPVQSLDGGKTWNPVVHNTDVAAAAAARAAGTATGQKQAALYANLNNIDAFNLTIDQLLTAPGRNAIYGASSILDPRNFVRGTDAQDAQKLRDQLASRSFLVSIQAMRGMGQLSNQEGLKVESALTAALAPGLDDQTAVTRLNELKTAIANLRNVAIQEANATENALAPPPGMGGAQPPTAPQAFPGAPPIGTVDGGFRYQGGDPASPASWVKVQ